MTMRPIRPCRPAHAAVVAMQICMHAWWTGFHVLAQVPQTRLLLWPPCAPFLTLPGGVVATSVFVFDVSIQTIHDIPDMLAAQGIGGGRTAGLTLFPGGEFAIPFRCVMPIGAGVIVAWLQTQVCECVRGGGRCCCWNSGVCEDAVASHSPYYIWAELLTIHPSSIIGRSKLQQVTYSLLMLCVLLRALPRLSRLLRVQWAVIRTLTPSLLCSVCCSGICPAAQGRHEGSGQRAG